MRPRAADSRPYEYSYSNVPNAGDFFRKKSFQRSRPQAGTHAHILALGRFQR